MANQQQEIELKSLSERIQELEATKSTLKSDLQKEQTGKETCNTNLQAHIHKYEELQQKYTTLAEASAKQDAQLKDHSTRLEDCTLQQDESQNTLTDARKTVVVLRRRENELLSKMYDSPHR
ncbi:hypothetical protein CYMTET_12582, partial [Cymbomonas tetramitiformis]